MERDQLELLKDALMKAQGVICRLKLSMMAHPDCTESSELDDYTTMAQEVEDEIEKLLKTPNNG